MPPTDAARCFVRACDAFLASLDGDSEAGDFAMCRDRVAEVRGLVEDQFELDLPGGRQGAKRSHAETLLLRQLAYHKKAKKSLEESLAASAGKKIGASLPLTVITRVALSNPSLNSRELEECLAWDGAKPISHESITRVRNAFAEVLKQLCKAQVLNMVKAGCVNFDGKLVQPVFVNHMHDEALMRYRSFDKAETQTGVVAPAKTFSRGRYSKIQNNAISVSLGQSGDAAEWFMELQPLGRKDGQTLASAVLAAIRPILDTVIAGVEGRARRARVIHLLLGDGLNTNENAAKRVLHRLMLQSGAGDVLEYRLCLWKCASHQSNLAVSVAICGKLESNAVESNDLCATLSRLYKYLVPAYLSELTARLRDLVVDSFAVRTDVDSEEVRRLQSHTEKMIALYGKDILPQELVVLRNGDLSKMEHVSCTDSDKVRIRQDMFDLLLRLVWLVEERPVVTRFFLFAPCCFALLRMYLLGLPASLLSVGALRAEAKQSKRLAAVRSFYESPTTPALLRRACLALRLTLYATSLTAKKVRVGTPSEASEPMLVRLGRREVQLRTSTLLADIVPKIPDDPVLDQAATLHTLLLTQAHLVIRFDAYLRFPTRLWRLTKKFNSMNFAEEILQFLHLDDAVLDAGYSLPLKREAWLVGDNIEARAVAHLMSDSVQAEVAALLENASVSTLDVERKHQQDKRSETTKVTGCATASRNSILRRYLLRQKGAAAAAEKAKNAKLAAARTSVRALAIQQRPELLSQGRGQLHWESGVSSEERRGVRRKGDEAQLAAYIEEHRQSLQDELDRRRSAAQVQAIVADGVPMTSDAVRLYLEEHEQTFRELMKTAGADRKALMERLQPDDGLVSCARVYPVPSPATGSSPEWSHLGDGFVCFRSGTENLVCFIASIGYIVYAAPLAPTARGSEFTLMLQPLFCDQLKPIASVLDTAGFGGDLVLEVYRLTLKPLGFHADRVSLGVCGAVLVPRPAARAKRGAAAASENAADAEQDEEAFADMAANADKLGDFSSSDAESLCSSEEADTSSDDEGGKPVVDSDGDEEESELARQPAGTHVVSSNGYFTLTDNRNYPDVRMSIMRKWCVKGELGVGEWSKTVVPKHYGDDRACPTRSFLVLRAWMLWRARRGGWCSARSSRRKVFADEFRALRKELHIAGGGAPTTGNAAADERMKEWLPELFSVSAPA